MTQNYTVFLNAYAAAFNGLGALPDNSDWATEFDQGPTYQVVTQRRESMVLNLGESRVLSFPGGLSLADWHLFLLRVVGTGRLHTTGKDQDGTTNISADSMIFGTRVLPGILILSTYNLTGVTIESLADGSVFELFDAKCQ